MNINEAIERAEKLDPEIAAAIKKYVRDHAYGLVFEENLPDAVRLYKKTPCPSDVVNILPERGCMETEENKTAWAVKEVNDGTAVISNETGTKEVPVEDLVVCASPNTIIYPGLKEIDRVENGSPDDPYHILINAENYHALEMLLYAYAGKVDCLYIDPPYNTGAKDWKYNNNYVDSSDKYMHSKWLSFMKRRLELAKLLLNKDDSVLIVTIDEKEYLRLGMLLEQMFPKARIQMISSVISRKGSSRAGMCSRVDEFIYLVQFGTSSMIPTVLSNEWLTTGLNQSTDKDGFQWQPLRKGQRDKDTRKCSPGCFYPIYVSTDGLAVKDVGDPIPLEADRNDAPNKDGCITVWPIMPDGREGSWRMSASNFKSLLKAGFVKINGFSKNGNWACYYISSGIRKKITDGKIKTNGYDENGTIIIDNDNTGRYTLPNTQWNIKSHDATYYGTKLNQEFLPDRKFSYPKSLYAVEDCIRFFVANKPNALILDFFAGSGTTAHATMLLNHLDGGHRRCISVTNNEVSAEEQKAFIKKGLRPGDPEWEEKGIASYITWPRIKAAITGINTLGEPIKGDYKFTEEFPMSEGLKENAVFLELTYESEWPIRLDRSFNAIAPILWLKAGCKGPIIRKIGKSYLTTDYYGVLFDYSHVSKFCEKVKATPTIKTAYVVTDDQRRYSNVCRRLPGIEVHRLYESYLRTFEICGEGGWT